MLFSPWCYGHYPSYLRHLVSSWYLRNQDTLNQDRLHIVVTPRFLQEHGDVVEMAREKSPLQFVPITEIEQARLEATSSGVSRSFEQYRLITRYARSLKATRGLILYFDSCQLPLVLGLPLPCPFSGIYFRPTFHYPQFSQASSTRKEQLQHLRERVFLKRLFQHRQIETLFCLDPFAVEAMNHSHRFPNAVYLPDPVSLSPAAEMSSLALKQNLGIDLERKIFLSFGRLADERKGIPQLLQAVTQLSDNLSQKLCLLFAGEPAQSSVEQLEAWFAPLRQAGAVQIVTHYHYVPESEVSSYFQLADAVMAPYQKHIGMSGILLQAAVAQKPVLSSSYGLMGELVKRYKLGIAVDSTQPAKLAEALTRLLQTPPEQLCDHRLMQAFAAQNSVEQFTHTIWQHLLPQPPHLAQEEQL